jgi:hypothetical protein
MAKSKRHEMDRQLAEELGLTLAPFVLTVKHVTKLQGVGKGFFFAFEHKGQLWYDRAPVWNESLGCRIKPERFFLPDLVAKRLREHHYQRWYFHDHSYLYPVQMAKLDKLHQLFWFVPDPDPLYRSEVIFEVDKFQLRRKALRSAQAPQPGWDDCAPYVVRRQRQTA